MVTSISLFWNPSHTVYLACTPYHPKGSALSNDHTSAFIGLSPVTHLFFLNLPLQTQGHLSSKTTHSAGLAKNVPPPDHRGFNIQFKIKLNKAISVPRKNGSSITFLYEFVAQHLNYGREAYPCYLLVCLRLHSTTPKKSNPVPAGILPLHQPARTLRHNIS
ncbi:hypothetical protein OPQ81_011112 [Rhizoctonia solani]|nr:hypothetical protein OPQ81_011112 [Rhizoctonia solani]